MPCPSSSAHLVHIAPLLWRVGEAEVDHLQYDGAVGCVVTQRRQPAQLGAGGSPRLVAGGGTRLALCGCERLDTAQVEQMAAARSNVRRRPGGVAALALLIACSAVVPHPTCHASRRSNSRAAKPTRCRLGCPSQPRPGVAQGVSNRARWRSRGWCRSRGYTVRFHFERALGYQPWNQC